MLSTPGRDPGEIRSAEALLTTIVTRLCLDQLKSAQSRREVYPGIWLPEPVLTPPMTLADDPLDSVIKLESISLAFLHLLESVGPEERAVFLLREVFDYDYAAIAQFLQKSESACRQIFSRAKKHIADQRPRVLTSADEHQRVLTSFVQAVQSGNLENLMTMMAEDVHSYADGGGKAAAPARRLTGRETVARLVQGLQRTGFRPGDQVALRVINGRQGLLIRNAQGQVTTVLCLDIADGLIQGLYFVRNPEKLQNVA